LEVIAEILHDNPQAQVVLVEPAAAPDRGG
jgi:hypothetical protein